jgi:glutamate racemase
MPSSENHAISALRGKNHVTVLITDSGLGGMSIFAEIAAGLKRRPIFPRVSMVYYNAWPELNRGYNRLKDTAERIRVFDQALAGAQRYRPDVVMIACNTLSVLYEYTAFSRQRTIPVVDIVRFGVDLLYQQLVQDAEAAALLLGTVTTITSGAHRSQLIAKGIAPDRLVSQVCDQLATRIESGPDSDGVAQMVEGFMSQAAQKLAMPRSRVFAALFCTHFGYVGEKIRASLQRRIGSPVSVLDPNRAMAAWLFEAAGGPCHDRSTIDMHVVSRIVWDQDRINAIARATSAISPESAQALRCYEHIPDLFELG